MPVFGALLETHQITTADSRRLTGRLMEGGICLVEISKYRLNYKEDGLVDKTFLHFSVAYDRLA